MERLVLDITGMRCGACAAGIEIMLKKKTGIRSVKVSLNDRAADIEYDPALVALPDIVKAVKDFGYIAAVRR